MIIENIKISSENISGKEIERYVDVPEYSDTHQNKLAVRFLVKRYTREQVLDEEGNPVLYEENNPVTELKPFLYPGLASIYEKWFRVDETTPVDMYGNYLRDANGNYDFGHEDFYKNEYEWLKEILLNKYMHFIDIVKFVIDRADRVERSFDKP